jgi:hypothetical protein
MEDLERQKQSAKLTIYYKFFCVLAIYVGISGLLILFQSLFSYWKLEESYWYHLLLLSKGI